MQVPSSFAPWPLPSRFSKAVQTLVMIPPVVVVIVVSDVNTAVSSRTKLKRRHTFPRLDVVLIEGAEEVDGMKVEVAADVLVLSRRQYQRFYR